MSDGIEVEAPIGGADGHLSKKLSSKTPSFIPMSPYRSNQWKVDDIKKELRVSDPHFLLVDAALMFLTLFPLFSRVVTCLWLERRRISSRDLRGLMFSSKKTPLLLLGFTLDSN